MRLLYSLLAAMLSLSAGTTPILHSRPEAWPKLYIDTGSYPWDATEQQQIETIQFVAHLYEPFNIDVATENPGPRTNVAWIVVGGPLQGAIAGQAGVGSWGAGTLYGRANAGEVYADGLGNDPVTVGIAIAHEAGHLFGLTHEDSGVMYPTVQSSPDVTWTAADVDYFGRVVGFAPASSAPEPSTISRIAALTIAAGCLRRPARMYGK